MSTTIYMDYNATAPMRPEVRALMMEVMGAPRNASSVHALGREARAMVEHARSTISRLTGAPPEQVVFNSGATEANNTVLNHFAQHAPNERILLSSIEHPSVLDSPSHADHIPVTPEGLIDLNALEKLLQDKKTALVSVMLVNNETGVIQPLRDISALAHKYGALVHCDGVQAAGRIPININTLGIDFLTLSAHKIGGPQGVGALILGLCGITPTLLHGGGQEKKARAGTENVTGIVGFGKACEIAIAEMTKYQNLETLRDQLEDRLRSIEGDIEIHGEHAPRVANTSMFSLPGMRTEAALMALDLDGIAISNGSACSSGTVHPSHVLKAMGADDTQASSALRISLGWNTQPSDIERFIESFSKLHARISNRSS